MATLNPEPLKFVIAGTITTWDPKVRLLRIDGHELWAARDLSVANVVTGATATVSGHDEPFGRRVVTRLTVD
jgi:hypothetical protein